MPVVQRKDLHTPLTKQQEYFSDFYPNLDTHPTKNDLLRATNEAAVKVSIRNLLETNRGEHFFEGQSIGSDVRKQLFELGSPATESVMADLIRNTIENHEPRVRLLNVTVNVDLQSHTMIATIVFSLINKQEPITLEVILDRVR